MQLTDDELYSLFVQAGFPRQAAVVDDPESGHTVYTEDRAAMMTAVALRESNGNAYAFNGNAATGDQSYGLVQINYRNPDIAVAVTQNGFHYPEMLFNPELNAEMAFKLYAGRRQFMNTLWYIDRPGTARDRYLALLPRAQAAAARYKG